MDLDDPRRPLLGHVPQSRARRLANKLCSLESWRRRVPITIWLPNYKLDYLLRDFIAGITVGLTSIPQGIAYALVAGLPPQVGLYSSIFPGVVYSIFGSCKDVTVGPTAILSALLAKYVAKSVDFAYLAAFLSGCIILLLGVLQLGFVLDFISKPVISGFTTAAALQIAAAQLKTLFRVEGSSGNTFIDALINFFKHIMTIHLWDSALGIASIVALLLLKRLPTGGGGILAAVSLHASRARNALVVLAGASLAAGLHARGIVPFALAGKIEGGLPHFGLPPFSTTVGNSTLNFEEMLSVFGAEGLVMPLVAVLESIAIAKAFAGGAGVDVTQEMVAVGACNVAASLAQGMPATGSFTRTALNRAAGVATPAGSLVKASVVLLAVTLLADAFYYIPRAALAGVIVVAMMSIIDFSIVITLWRNNKGEMCTWAVTVIVGAAAGLEYGILCGALADLLRLLLAAARPRLHTHLFKVGNIDCMSVTLVGAVSYASAEWLPRKLRRVVDSPHSPHSPHSLHSPHAPRLLVLDGRHVHSIDVGVAEMSQAVPRVAAGIREETRQWAQYRPACIRTGHHRKIMFVTLKIIVYYLIVNASKYNKKKEKKN
ncbi:sodium-independent sulfate anion transporter-like isoform X1 [Galleria mellonella]|uniref:Sodium-independent sulfate anion transporter-like isoform X1 n=1 Tax=Galleria mellonella TaxID=7137 RepID=A0ABM3MFR0_GALME|nr:sodium-independent sulfate anion transporter-like isoform X1 [Galleria mellonella]